MKIMLGQTASDALKAIGPHHLAIITRADSTAPPQARGRLLILCLPLTAEKANDAFQVATGRAKALKTKKPATGRRYES